MIEKPLRGSDADAAKNKIKVLYIAGWGRSGSTILGRILGQVEDFFMIGELRYVWDRGLIENRLCSCGTPFRECPLWQEVMFRAFGGNDRIDAKELVELRERGLRTRHVLLAPTRQSLQARVDRMDKYLEASERLYRAVRDVSSSKVIVDTSKFPSYAYLLRNVPNIELYLLHLVRDPRAVAYSWASRKKPQSNRGEEAGNLMKPHSLIGSSLAWNEWNFAIERAWKRVPERYMWLRYEDFVESPQNTVESILQFLGEKEAESPFVNEREISLEMTHTFSGNPDRFRSGTVTVKPDEEWRHKMGNVQQASITALTCPGLVRYGYPLRPQRDLIDKRARCEGSWTTSAATPRLRTSWKDTPSQAGSTPRRSAGASSTARKV
jgi:hypothetical protein